MTATADFLASLRLGLTKCHVLKMRLLVAVSGGADSVALLRGLLELQEDRGLSLHVAHLNHKLRGPASDADACWVKSFCETLGVPVEIGTVDSTDLNSDQSALEETARDIRHEFFNTTLIREGCEAIVLAHSADDQVETVLHHIWRGTGMSGLRGIPWERKSASNRPLIRPMLGIRRERIEAYLHELGQDFCTDVTNADASMTRNWLRHELLPQLRVRFGTRVDLSLTRLSEQAAEMESAMVMLADPLLDQALLQTQTNTVRLHVGGFVDQPRHLVRTVFVQLWQRQRWPRQSMGFEEWDRLTEIAIKGGAGNFPGNIDARRTTERLMILRQKSF